MELLMESIRSSPQLRKTSGPPCRPSPGTVTPLAAPPTQPGLSRAAGRYSDQSVWAAAGISISRDMRGQPATLIPSYKCKSVEVRSCPVTVTKETPDCRLISIDITGWRDGGCWQRSRLERAQQHLLSRHSPATAHTNIEIGLYLC